MNLKALERFIRLLDSHQAADDKETSDVQLIKQMALANPAIFSKTNFPGHVTGSALILDLQAGRVLLHYHKSLARWLQFGGHAEDGETDPADTAMREAREESGVEDLAFWPDEVSPRPADIDIHMIPARNGQPDHLHLDIRYLLSTEQPERVAAADGESSRFMWLSLDELEKMESHVDPSLRRFLHKARRIYRRK